MTETTEMRELDEELEEPLDEALVGGRPVEDRSFEAVEAGVGLAAGVAIGAAIAGPIGAAAGGVVGAAAGFLAGEALERHEGLAAKTTDAEEPSHAHGS